MKTITLEKFHELLNDAYAVDVNDTLLFVGYDENGPFTSDGDGDGYLSLAEVDGDIEVTDDGLLFFHVAEEPILLKILNVTPVKA